MGTALLNLISTPVPVLNTLGLNVRVGLSSEDPKVGGQPSESFQAFLSVYSSEGLLLERSHLGEIPPNRRRFFDISDFTGKFVESQDHLTVVHRVPSRLLSDVSDIDGEIDASDQPDYFLYRSLVEYSYPGGGNGSLIYETPPRLNASTSSNTLSFSNQIVISEFVNTYMVLISYSVDPSYSHISNYYFGVYSLSGRQVASGHATVTPFTAKVLDMAQLIPEEAVKTSEDPSDGLSTFTFVGSCDDAVILVLSINAAPALGAVAVEHTHPAQTYLFPFDPAQQRRIKGDAQGAWKSILSQGGTR